MQQLRSTILSDVEVVATKQRFALFSQPPPLAVGDDSQYKTLIHPKGQDGKPITEARNFAVSPNKSGVLKSSYFKVPDSVYIGDPYVDPHRRELIYQNSRYRTGKYHETEFKPASGSKTLANSAYKYEPHSSGKYAKKVERDENGRVKTQARNILTNPCEKVETKLLKFPQHMPDPYERKEQLEREYNKKQRFKIAETNFKSMSHPLKTFNKPAVVYGTDVKIPQRKMKPQSMANIVNHETAFKPSKTTPGTLNKFPQYMPQNPIAKLFKHKQDGKEEKEIFKPSRNSLSRPTPSISLNHINLRRSTKF